MPFHSEGLSSREWQMVNKLVLACRLLNDIYWRQADLAGLRLKESTLNQKLRRILRITGGCRVSEIERRMNLPGRP